MTVPAQIPSAMLAPGWQARRRRLTLGVVLLVVGVVTPIVLLGHAVATGRNAVAMGLDADYLGVVVVVGLMALLARVAAMIELWFATGRPTSFTRVEAVAIVASLATFVVGSMALAEVQGARGTVAPVFVTSSYVLFDSDESVPTTPR